MLWQGERQGPENAMQYEVIDFAEQVEAGASDPAGLPSA